MKRNISGDLSGGLDRCDVLCAGCSFILELDLLCLSDCGQYYAHLLHG